MQPHRPRSRSVQPQARARRGCGLAAIALVALTAGCSAPVRPELPSAPPPSASASVPADGLSLRMVGVTNGPVDAFSLPSTLVISTSVDQPSGVTIVMSEPAATEVAAYLRRTLPRTGFSITADNQDTASMTFTGYGWQGSFTGTGHSSAVLLRP